MRHWFLARALCPWHLARAGFHLVRAAGCFLLLLCLLPRFLWHMVQGYRVVLRDRARRRQIGGGMEAERMDRLRHPEKYRGE